MKRVLVAEHEMTRAQEQRIQELLIAAYPQYAELWSRQSFWGGPAEYRVWLEHEDKPIAHLGFARRTISVGNQEVLIAGIGAVCTHPEFQGRGVGKQLFTGLKRILLVRLPVEFAYLECREAVIGFYEKVGFTYMRQTVHCFHPDKQMWLNDTGAKMVMPIRKTITEWDSKSLIDLRGMPW
jgi:ribosomal protein S18 acetylase RimI-like enzyme